MKKINIKELLEEIKKDGVYFDEEDIIDLVIEFSEHSNGYICDIISSVADNNVDIYNYKLWEWAKNNESYIEEAVAEYGINERNFDLMQLFRSGQYNYYTQAIYSNLAVFIKYSILYNINVEEISEEALEEIENIANEEDNNAEIDIYIDKINDLIESEKE